MATPLASISDTEQRGVGVGKHPADLTLVNKVKAKFNSRLEPVFMHEFAQWACIDIGPSHNADM
jgi:hypothetical protein